MEKILPENIFEMRPCAQSLWIQVASSIESWLYCTLMWHLQRHRIYKGTRVAIKEGKNSSFYYKTSGKQWRKGIIKSYIICSFITSTAWSTSASRSFPSSSSLATSHRHTHCVTWYWWLKSGTSGGIDLWVVTCFFPWINFVLFSFFYQLQSNLMKKCKQSMKREGTVFFLLMRPRMTVIQKTGMFPSHHHHTYILYTNGIFNHAATASNHRSSQSASQVPIHTCMLEEKHTWRKLEKSSMHNILTESIFYIFNKKNTKIDNLASSILLPLSSPCAFYDKNPSLQM